MVSKKVFVLSVGGSILIGDQPRVEVLQAVGKQISELHQEGYSIILVCGGGVTARNYVNAMKTLGANNYQMDDVGIDSTRLNVRLLIQATPGAHQRVVTSVKEAKDVLLSGQIPVLGGLIPGFTTDSVGALVAEYVEGTFVNLTNVDGIYDVDPRNNPNAKRFETLDYATLVDMIAQKVSKPGQNLVLDLACCSILKRSKIPAVILNGNDLENWANFIRGKEFVGTTIL